MTETHSKPARPFGYEKATPTCQKAVDFLYETAELLIEKNKKYKDSAASPLRVFSKASPLEQILVRIDDKLSRIGNTGHEAALDEDTVRDLVGYLALLRGVQG